MQWANANARTTGLTASIRMVGKTTVDSTLKCNAFEGLVEHVLWSFVASLRVNVTPNSYPRFLSRPTQTPRATPSHI